ncbi:hypothetical protein CK203_061598 [Vitis vinifera]|uniref:SLC26A/SulP transporter domain-containing protein n=1 Tax=Vitis vinifera TaxID=29760 RepID=A0A438G9G4_VITVI|nr:hypothetical protein CK203_061598 [Vitis vinifera]
MVRAFKVHELNGLEILTWEDAEIRESNEGEICVKNQAIEVSFIDICHDKGVCRAATIPFTPSMKAVRTVTAVGSQRLGFLVDLLSPAAIVGFMGGHFIINVFLTKARAKLFGGPRFTGYTEPGRIMAVVGPSGSTLNLDLFGMGLHSYQIWLGRTLHQILIDEDLAWPPLVGHP